MLQPNSSIFKDITGTKIYIFFLALPCMDHFVYKVMRKREIVIVGLQYQSWIFSTS